MNEPELYLLPTHPSQTSLDPLGICESTNTVVTQDEVLVKLLRMWQEGIRNEKLGVNSLPELIDQVRYSLHMVGSSATGYLDQFLRSLTDEHVTQDSLCKAIEGILENALELSQVFPASSLPFLSHLYDRYDMSASQIDALLAHEFLGSLSAPPGNNWGQPGFTSWFAQEPVNEQATRGYIQTILSHFATGGYSEPLDVTFHLHTASAMPLPSHCEAFPDIEFRTVLEETDPSPPNFHVSATVPFVLVPSNWEPGPGPAATHEERLMAASPALTISSLLTPVIPDDAAVITSALPVHASWAGHGRTAQMREIYPPDGRPQRRYILADAIPLDGLNAEEEEEGLRDLADGRVEREIRKLYAAFSGAAAMAQEAGEEDCIIEAGPWGCGAFGGNLVVKAICMAIAAGLADMKVAVIVAEPPQWHSQPQTTMSARSRLRLAPAVGSLRRLEELQQVRKVLGAKKTVAALWRFVADGDLRGLLEARTRA